MYALQHSNTQHLLPTSTTKEWQAEIYRKTVVNLEAVLLERTLSYIRARVNNSSLDQHSCFLPLIYHTRYEVLARRCPVTLLYVSYLEGSSSTGRILTTTWILCLVPATGSL